MARWSWGEAARSSRPARDSTTVPWWLDCSICIAAFHPPARLQRKHPILEFACQSHPLRVMAKDIVFTKLAPTGPEALSQSALLASGHSETVGYSNASTDCPSVRRSVRAWADHFPCLVLPPHMAHGEGAHGIQASSYPVGQFTKRLQGIGYP